MLRYESGFFNLKLINIENMNVTVKGEKSIIDYNLLIKCSFFQTFLFILFCNLWPFSANVVFCELIRPLQSIKALVE